MFYSDRVGDTDVWTIPASGGTPQQLTFQQARTPAWSPDGRTVAFSDPRGLWTIPATGGTPSQLVVAGDVSNDAWSRDGTAIYFRRAQAIWRIDVGSGVSAPTEVARLGDPAHQAVRKEFAVDDHRFVVPLTEHDADLWLLELDRKP
jgi:Tol biopolymer transport system component